MKGRIIGGMLLLGAVVGLVVLSIFAQDRVRHEFDKHGLAYSYDLEKDCAQPGAKSGPVPVLLITRKGELNALRIAFRFSTREPTFSYGNLFQTGDSSEAIRMELQPPKNLVLVASGRVYPVSQSIQLNRYHAVVLRYAKGSGLYVLLDGVKALELPDEEISAGQVDFAHVVVGTGLTMQRTLIGSVRDFDIHVEWSNYGNLAILSRILITIVCAVFFFASFRNYPIGGSTSFWRPDSSAAWDIALTFAAVLIPTAVVIAAIGYLGQSSMGYLKWCAYAAPAAVLPILVLRHRSAPGSSSLYWTLCLVSSAYAAFIFYDALLRPGGRKALLILVIAISAVAFGLTMLRGRIGSGGGRKGWIFSGAVAVWSGTLLAISWSAISYLPNWEVFEAAVDRAFGVTVGGAFLLARVLLGSVLFRGGTGNASAVSRYGMGDSLRPAVRLFDVVAILGLLWISFRYDSLFVPGSQYHWEYYVGVIEGIQRGGWLLWDIPSQYGFLNILLASLMPGGSAWQSFYIFQSSLLFIAATAIYVVARHWLPPTLPNRLILFLLIFMSLYFADPAWIGPYPFPSSSVVRFFPVYVFILAACTGPKGALRHALLLSAIWTLAVIWAAECAVYVTAGYLFFIAGVVLSEPVKRRALAVAGMHVATAVGLLAGMLSFIYLFYFLKAGTVPDLSGYAEYAMGYAGGLGYVPFPLGGPGNLMLLCFVGIAILGIKLLREDNCQLCKMVPALAAMAGCVWGITSYYVGRPVPQNITALLPLLMLTTFLSIRMACSIGIGLHGLPIRAAGFSIFLLILIPLFNADWLGQLHGILSFSAEISSRLPKADDALVEMLDRAGVADEALVSYYGDDAAPPIFAGQYERFNDRAWLPAPLQLLEAPLSKERRMLYLRRYLCRVKAKEGILIYRVGDVATRLSGFVDALQQYYRTSTVFNGKAYSIYKFSGIDDFVRESCN